MKSSYPDCRLNAQKEYDQVARDYGHGFQGDINFNCRYEALILFERQRLGFGRSVSNARSYKEFVLKRRRDTRTAQLAEGRAQLQQRFNEEAAFVRFVLPLFSRETDQ